MKLTHLVATLTFAIAAGCSIPAIAADHGNIDKVLGSAVVGSNEHYADISLVNGSIQMASDSSAKDISVVNGSVDIRDNVSVRSISTVNGGIETGSGLKVSGELSTVNGEIQLGEQSVIDGNIESVNGDITLKDSTTAGDISTVNGDISLNGATVVKGDVIFKQRNKRKSWFNFGSSNKPTLYIAADAVVEGQIILEQKVTLKLENPAMQAKVVERINDGR